MRRFAERKEFIILFFILFVVVDPLITFIRTSGFNMLEGNSIISVIIEAENGWMIWLFMKIIIGLVGAFFMFSAYYIINTQTFSKTDREKAILVEYGAWSFIICFLFIIILDWASNITLSHF